MTVLTLTTGTAFIMWLGEQITERGIGNGMSLLIFAGIVVGFPRGLIDTFQMIQRGELNLLAALLLVAMMVVVVGGHRVRGARPAAHHRAVREARGGPAHVRRPVHPPAPARQHERRDPGDLRLLDHRLPPDHRLLLPGQQPLDADGLRAAPVGDAALQPPLRHLHHLLLLLLHRHRLQPRRRGGEHAEVRGLHPRDPAGQADRRSTSTTSWAASPSAAPSTWP